MAEDEGPKKEPRVERRLQYEQAMLVLRATFAASPHKPGAGKAAVAARAGAVDALIHQLWAEAVASAPRLSTGVALLAVGGYGRRELFPYSDVDVMFLLDAKALEAGLKDPIRAFNQALWDSGLRVSPMTRSLAECERLNPENVEFTLSLLDARLLVGDAIVARKLTGTTVPRLIAREGKKVAARLLEVTRVRHARYGDTLFHLEPNVKDCPGGLRDAHVHGWLSRLLPPAQGGATAGTSASTGFNDAREFLLLVRTFLHLRHQRDDNVLDWHAQDEAASVSLGIAPSPNGAPLLDAAYWMRLYFRHARVVERTAAQAIESAAAEKPASRLPGMAALRRLTASAATGGFELRRGRVFFADEAASLEDPAHDPEIMLAIFTTVAETGARLARETEWRLEDALPLLSAHLEDGPGLWRHLRQILTGPHAGLALRGMHALGILELLIPEFHGIDALVIRDAYHRYTVDEHTFVLIDTLHGLIAAGAATPAAATGLEVWASRFASILRELPHPGLLYLAALLHDIGKGHSAAGSNTGHAAVSAKLAASVLERLQMESFEVGLVLGLIENHLEMSAALRRDVFDAETVRAFAARVPTPEALRMLTLFTYADISAVHPDALTPWKAENLWRLHIATSNYLDRSVDDERLGLPVLGASAEAAPDLIHRVTALVPDRSAELARFLEGLPQRYLLTRTPEQVRAHLEMAERLEASDVSLHGAPRVELDFRYAPDFSELTLISTDRPMLFADMAGALAAWGMNVVTADAFSNRHGLVVDSFRFTDTFRTLEMNESERTRFVASIREAISGAIPAETMLAARRRGRRRTPKVAVESRIDLDHAASSHSTLLQVVAQDTPGLLRALSLTMAAQGCNIEVALVDTEGEMAIDVFYITRGGQKLSPEQEGTLRRTLLEAIEANAR